MVNFGWCRIEMNFAVFSHSCTPRELDTGGCILMTIDAVSILYKSIFCTNNLICYYPCIHSSMTTIGSRNNSLICYLTGSLIPEQGGNSAHKNERSDDDKYFSDYLHHPDLLISSQRGDVQLHLRA